MLRYDFLLNIFALIENETDNFQFFDYIFFFINPAQTKYGAWAKIPQGRQTDSPHLITKRSNFPHKKMLTFKIKAGTPARMAVFLYTQKHTHTYIHL